jgi:hypothetical protein
MGTFADQALPLMALMMTGLSLTAQAQQIISFGYNFQ